MTILPTITGLGTTWWVEIFDEISTEQSQVIHDDVRLFIAEFDAKYSRFTPDSYISTLNAAHKLPQPEPEVIKILEYGLKLYHDTNGVFNFLIGEQLASHGYDPLYSFSPKDESFEIPDPTDVLLLSDMQVILSVGHIDIGGYGKGYLIDLIAGKLTDEYGLKEFLINGGGDMYATAENGKPVTIYLEHPTSPNTYIAETTLFYEGFAASSTHKRRWEHAGKTYTHIIDSKTGESSQNSVAVFVKAPTAKAADGWSTTLLLSAPENHIGTILEQKLKVAIYHEQLKTIKQYGEF
jgi:thiamine biosynthesis lipoprotein